MLYAFNVVMSGTQNFRNGASSPTPEADTWAKDYLVQRVNAKGIPLNVLTDLTDSLPAPTAHPPTLSEADFVSAAADLGVEVAAVHAVQEVEVGVGGHGFGPDGRPIIRYELHIFQGQPKKDGHGHVVHDEGGEAVYGGQTEGHFRKTHPYLSQPSLGAGNAYHSGGQKREYSMLYNAMLLKYKAGRAIEQAIASTSWGRFQVMGFNYGGYPADSALEFARAMYVSEGNHLKAFLGYIRSAHLVHALQRHDWAAVARGYNGPGYAVNNYDGQLEDAYDRWSHK